MAKKTEKVEIQDDIFPQEPVIGGFGVVSHKLKGSEVDLNLVGVTNVNDLARLTPESWQAGAAKWLVGLCQDDIDVAMIAVKKAYLEIQITKGEPHRTTPVVEIGMNYN